MNNTEEKLAMVLDYLEELKEIFQLRPRMLGAAADVNATFFYLDAIELIANGHKKEKIFEVSWTQFLIEKKLIVGADDKLRRMLNDEKYEYSALQSLRREYFLWRKEKIGF